MATTTAALPRLDSLTGLRWWAAFAVFLFHIRNLVELPGPIAKFVLYGNFGVAFFFILSGFVLTWSWRETVGTGTFYWRRFARVYPLHLVTLLLAIPVFYRLSPDPAEPWIKPFDVAILILCFLLLQGWSRDPVVLFAGNPVSWTLTVEAFFYALHPALIRGLRRLSGRAAMLTALGVVVLSIVMRITIIAAPSSWFAMLPWPVLRVNEFVIGMCLAWAFRCGWRLRLSVWIPALLIFAYFIGVSVLDRFAITQGLHLVMSQFISEAMIVLFSLLICAAASTDLRGNRALGISTRWTVVLGEWSFAFYLIHGTILYIILEFLGGRVGGWTGLALLIGVLALSILASGALHVWVERPMERRMRRWQDRRNARKQDPLVDASRSPQESAADAK